MSDSVTASRVRDPGIARMLSIESRWQAWLDVEAALARAEAEVGLIPELAAQAITEAARLDKLDRGRIDEGFGRTAHVLVPLIWELARVVGPEHGGWVHWGATTQNIVVSGDLLILRRIRQVIRAMLDEVLEGMAALAERTAEMPMAGRTHGQHAVPITFGYKVAGWIDEILRHLDRMDESDGRIFVVMLGGAAGTYASLGAEGPRVQALMARDLRLGSAAVPSRASADRTAEYVIQLTMLAATVSRIGREIYTLMKTEFGEVEEPVPAGTVGSSTMPQKRNPKLVQDLLAAAAEVRIQAPLALEAMQIEHEADRTNTKMMQAAQARACIGTGDMLARLIVVIGGLSVHPDRMRENLDRSGGLIMSEALMLRLGRLIGRQNAHDVVYDAAQQAVTKRRPFLELLLDDTRITGQLDAAAIAALLDPSGYVGLSADMARSGAARARPCAAPKLLIDPAWP